MAAFQVVATRNVIGLRRWRWNLVADNGEVVASSESYNSRGAALHGATVVQQIASDARIEEVNGL